MLKTLWKKRRAVLVGGALVTALFLAAFYFIFSSPVDLSSQHERVEAIIESRTGMRVHAESIILRAFPRIDLTLKNVAAFDGNEALLKIKSLRILLPLTSIFSDSLKINSLDVDGFELNVKKSADGRMNISRLFAGSGKPIALKKLNLTDSSVSFTDETVNAAYRVSGLKAAVTRTPRGFDYSAQAVLAPGVKMAMRGTGDDRKGKVKLSGTFDVKGFDLSRIDPYVKKALSGASVSGRAEFISSFSYDNGFKAKGRLSYTDAAAALPGLLARPLVSPKGSATMNLSMNADGASLNVETINLAFDALNLSGSLRIDSILEKKGGKKKPPVFKLNLASTPAEIKTLLTYVPAAFDKVVKKFQPAEGTVKLDGLALSGTTDDLGPDAYKKPGFLKASVTLDRVKVKYAGLERPITNGRGTAAFHDNAVAFDGFTFRYGNIVIDDLSGSIQDPFKKAAYDITVNSTIETSELTALAKQFLKDREAVDENKRKLDMARVRGRAGLNLKLSGEGFDFKDARYAGALKLYNIEAGYGDFPISLKSLKGTLSFDNKKITAKELAGVDKFESAVRADASVENYLSKEPLLSARVTGAIRQETLDQALLKWNVEGPVYGGNMPFTILVSGNPASLSAQAAIDFTPISVEYKNLIQKAARVQAAVKGSFSLAGPELTINELTFAFGKARIDAGGRVTLGKKPAYSLFAKSDRISPDDISRISTLLVDTTDAGGFAAFQLKAEKSDADRAPLLSGELTVKNGRFNAAFLPSPVEKLDADLKFGNDAIDFALSSFKAGNTDLKGRFNVKNNAVRLDVDATGFYLEDLIKKTEPGEGAPQALPSAAEAPQQKPSRIKKLLSSLFETDASSQRLLTGAGAIKIKKGALMGRTFEDFSAAFTLDKNALSVEPIHFLKNGGEANAAVTVYREKANPALFDAWLDFSNVQLEPFFAEMGARKKILTGPAHGVAALSAARNAAPFTAGLNGAAHLGSEDGTLHRFMLINKIFSIVNIFSITELFDEGMQYKYVSGDFAIKDGVISTDNLKLDASAMRMSALGKIDLPKSEIDAVLAMHPFVTIDKIVTTIPLAGWIIGGEQKSTLSMYYDIKGPLKSPDVGPAPIKAVGSGVVGILQRLIEAPIELIKPEEKPK